MRLYWEKQNITKYVTNINWSGSACQAARSVIFSVVYSPNDKNDSNLAIKLGDKITFYPAYPDKTIIFVGHVTARDRTSEAGELTYTSLDGMNHLLRSSGTYKFANKTPEKITEAICKDINIKTGTLAKTKISIAQIFFQERPYYEIIMAVYTKAYRKTKKPYIAQMNGNKLEVIEKGKLIPELVIKQGETITESSYSENTDSMVNRVYIYDSSNRKIGSISNDKWVKRFGVFQNAISVDTGDGKTEAKTELHGVDKSASITIIGDCRCVSGMGVKIKDTRTGIVGKFWIENDTHEWSNGVYTTTLELTFKNIMDIQEEDEEQAAEQGNGENYANDATSSSALNDVLNQARKWLGIGENPPGSNHNEVTEYYGWDEQWCCMFIWAIFNKSGHGDLFMGGGKTAYCFDVMDYYKARGKFGSTPKIGALIIYGGEGHIGILESVDGSENYVTIEGNLSNDVKKSNGPSCGTVLGFCYIDYPVTTTATSDNTSITGTAKNVPDIQQSGICPWDFTIYPYWYTRWNAGSTQRKVADLWNATGRCGSSNGIATINGYYLIAVGPYFGVCGDLICVVLEDGTRLNCIVADEKGEDAGNPYGHWQDYPSPGYSLVEFESMGGNDYTNSGALLNVEQWKGKKVTVMINGGRYSGLG